MKSGSSIVVAIGIIAVVVAIIGALSIANTPHLQKTTLPTLTTSNINYNVTITPNNVTETNITTQPNITKVVVNKTITVHITSPVLRSALESAILNKTPVLGFNLTRVVVIFYDPQCPYCALELNETLPFFYYLAQSNYAAVIFVGVPAHQDSLQMLEILEAVYKQYGPQAFVALLDENYAYYVYLIDLYETGSLKTFQEPNATTLLEMASMMRMNLTNAEIENQSQAISAMINVTNTANVYAIPTIMAFYMGNLTYSHTGLINPEYLIGNITQALQISLPVATPPSNTTNTTNS